ncbi:ABC transporter permease subunit/CPBP intramembrane protease [Eubacterium ruminantium]|uniref:ABC transporter permease subunit/CPBP intramembrane protease n=1 Tax=Eubacterium ruminantium TaxID=42322 RepID=UPI0024792CCF|nr:ABC transporter permease subunit/CPBP intramembrane protease [Eubacterium ruminantium]
MKNKNNKIIRTLFKKELLDVLRDKKTVIMMLVVPVILYPLIFIAALGIMSFVQDNLETSTYNIVIDAEEDKSEFYDYLTGNSSSSDKKYVLKITHAEGGHDYEADVKKEDIDVYVECKTQSNAKDTDIEGRLQYNVYYLSSSTNSNYASEIVYKQLEEMNKKKSKKILLDENLDAEYVLNPIVYKYKNVASGKQSVGSILGSVLPFLLIISLLMGTMYPAIDTTAGEKERGTLETLLTLPVTNRQMIIGKFLTVALIGLISALLNIISLGSIVIYMTKIMKDNGLIHLGNTSVISFLPAILIGIIAILAFSLFISAITMCVTSFAKSYKEANNYITPLMMVVLFTGYIGFVPNVSLDGVMALVPVANICLLIKNLLIFKITVNSVAMVLLSNVLYAFLAIMLLSKIYDSESILFNDGRGGLQLFEKRSNLKKGGVPTVSDAWFTLLVVFVLVIYAGGLLQTSFGIYGVIGTQLIIVMIPLLMSIYTKKDLKETYSFKKCKPVKVLGSILLITGTIFVGMIISSIVSQLFPSSRSAADDSVNEILDNGFLLTLFVVALLPAVCEEMMFRGYIFAAARKKYRIVPAIIFVAVCFGIYHMSLARFFVTALLGAMLCVVVYYTGSIFPSMLMHFANNAFSVVAYHYPNAVLKVMPFLDDQYFNLGIGAAVFVGGVILMVVGIIILRRKSSKSNETAVS